MKTVKRYKNPAGGKISHVFHSAVPCAPVLPASRASSRSASSTDASASIFRSRLGSRASSSATSCSPSETAAVEETAREANVRRERDDPVAEEEENKKEVKTTSPMHSNAKEAWLAKRTDEHMSSLFIPPSCKPKILEFAVPHADNFSSLFHGYHHPPCHVNQPALGCYARYGYIPWTTPPSSASFPLYCSSLSYVPLVLLAPPADKHARPDTPPGKLRQQAMVHSNWQECIRGCQAPPMPPAHVPPVPPPQSIFTHVGIAPRRHFTVHPDWRPRVRW